MGRWSRREFLQSAAAAVAAGAACSSGCVRREPDPPGVTTIHFFTYATPDFIRLFEKQLVPAFETLHPHIRVRVNNSMGDAGYDSKLLTLVAGKMAPDVIHVTQNNFPFYAAMDMLLPLDDLLKRDAELHESDFYPQMI